MSDMEREMEELLSSIPDKAWDDEIEKMSIDGLNPGELDNLVHTLLARRLVEQLRSPEHCTPGLLQCALRFLKDNDITALPIPGSAHQMLKDKIAGLPFQPKLTGT